MTSALATRFSRSTQLRFAAQEGKIRRFSNLDHKLLFQIKNKPDSLWSLGHKQPLFYLGVLWFLIWVTTRLISLAHNLSELSIKTLRQTTNNELTGSSVTRHFNYVNKERDWMLHSWFLCFSFSTNFPQRFTVSAIQRRVDASIRRSDWRRKSLNAAISREANLRNTTSHSINVTSWYFNEACEG